MDDRNGYHHVNYEIIKNFYLSLSCVIPYLYSQRTRKELKSRPQKKKKEEEPIALPTPVLNQHIRSKCDM